MRDLAGSSVGAELFAVSVVRSAQRCLGSHPNVSPMPLLAAQPQLENIQPASVMTEKVRSLVQTIQEFSHHFEQLQQQNFQVHRRLAEREAEITELWPGLHPCLFLVVDVCELFCGRKTGVFLADWWLTSLRAWQTKSIIEYRQGLVEHEICQSVTSEEFWVASADTMVWCTGLCWRTVYKRVVRVCASHLFSSNLIQSKPDLI